MTAPTGEPPTALEVVHDDEAHRYLLHRGGDRVGVIDYRLVDSDSDDDVVDFHHTEIRPAARGAGLAGFLVRHALEDLRANGRTVIPSCWFVREFIEANDEFESLVATR